MTKTCVNCRWEPEWKKGIAYGTWGTPNRFITTGRCKAIVPYMVEDFCVVVMRDHNQRKCKAWEPKPKKASFKGIEFTIESVAGRHALIDSNIPFPKLEEKIYDENGFDSRVHISKHAGLSK